MTQKTTLTDLGTALQATIVEDGAHVDVSTATAKVIILKAPGGETIEKTAQNIGDGTDGRVQYIRVSGDIEDLGRWNYRFKVTFSGASIFTNVDWIPFEVVQ